MTANHTHRLVDVLGLGVVAMVGLSLLATAIPRMRQSARSSSCENNLKQLGLAAHNYHSAYNQLPMGSGGTFPGSVDEPMLGNANRLSFFVGLTPFMEQQALWEKISNPLRADDGRVFPPMGPVPWFDPDQYEPWAMRPPALACPADPTAAEFKTASSYTINYGDAVMDVGSNPVTAMPPYGRTPAALRGMFGRQMVFRFRDVLDGLSNTLMISESRIGGVKVAKNVKGLIERPSILVEAHDDDSTEFWPEGRGACWADGSLLSIGVQTILPPNSLSATSDKGELEGVMNASSLHGGGVHVLMGDGRVGYASDSIDAGDSESATVAQGHLDDGKTLRPGSPSPFGVWGAMGTRAAQDRVNLEELTAPVKTYLEAELAVFAKIELETWHASRGSASIQARQLDLTDEGILVLMTESGDVRRLGLSKFASRDAYRAVETHRARLQEQSARLLSHAEEHVGYLERKEFAKFAQDCTTYGPGMPESDDLQMDQLIAVLGTKRGELITFYDFLISTLKSDQPGMADFTRQGVQKGRGLHMEFIDGRWRLSFGRNRIRQMNQPMQMQMMEALMR